MNSLQGTREAPEMQERTNWTACEAPGRHQGGRKGPLGQPARHQRGTRETGKDQLDSLRGTREAGKDLLDRLGGTREAPGRPEMLRTTQPDHSIHLLEEERPTKIQTPILKKKTNLRWRNLVNVKN